MGYFRVVCSNGLTIWYGEECENLQIVHKHTINKVEFAIAEMMEKLDFFLTSKDLVKEAIKTLSDRKIEKWHVRLTEVLNATGINTKETNTDAIEWAVLKEIERGNTNDVVTDWMLYNAINEGYIFNDEINKKEESKRYELDAKVCEYMFNNVPVELVASN